MQNIDNKTHPSPRDMPCLRTTTQETMERGEYVPIFTIARMKGWMLSMFPEKQESS
jgi:hypothetical protein